MGGVTEREKIDGRRLGMRSYNQGGLYLLEDAEAEMMSGDRL